MRTNHEVQIFHKIVVAMFCALMAAKQDILNANVVMEDEFLPEGLMIWKAMERSCEGERAS